MRVRCPHCHNPIELVVDAELSDITCPSCDSHFSLADQETIRVPASVGRLDTGTALGHFELLERLGMGAFGTVWKARDTELDRTVAVKIPRKGQLDSAESEQFFREARATAQLIHPSIVPIHEVGREGDTVFIVSDYVEGVTLQERLSDQRLSVREAAEMCIKLADALHHAHKQSVVHRDVKPGNIMLDLDGSPHIMDFGLAKREAAEITMTVEGQVLGTPAYMSPEQAEGKGHQADQRADLYSLGVILFELVTGELPFRGESRMLIFQIIKDEPPSPRKLNGRVPKDIETICLKCLEKDPAKRYQTAEDLKKDLERFLWHEPILARPIGRIERGWRWCRRKPAIAGLSGALLLSLVTVAIGATAAFFLVREQRDIANEAQRFAEGARTRAASERDKAIETLKQSQAAKMQAMAARKQAEMEKQAAVAAQERERLAKEAAIAALAIERESREESADIVSENRPPDSERVTPYRP